MENFQNILYPDTISCCKKDEDCPNYLYLSNNKYVKCHESCLACKGGTLNDCISCYNQIEYNKYSVLDKIKIDNLKISTSTEYYWENKNHKKCIGKPDRTYLDEENLTIMPCYISCDTCREGGDSLNHNCLSCFTNSHYYHYLNYNSPNCYKESEVPHNYFLDDSDSTEIQRHFFDKCDDKCYSCIKPGDMCTSCSIGYYPKCTEVTSQTFFHCYKEYEIQRYFLDKNRNCLDVCDTNCKTCEQSSDGTSINCLSCNSDLYILFNNNCITNCPDGYYKFEKTCVTSCPAFTKTTLDSCFNCYMDPSNKCIYMGKNHLYDERTCLICEQPKTFICNEEYGILDDCFEKCQTCSQRGNITHMNCDSCIPSLCLVEGIGNCIDDDNSLTDFYFKTQESGKCIYKKCYETCKTCSGNGNILHHN